MSAHIEWNIDLTIFRDDSKKITESKAQELYGEIMELIEFEYGLLVGGGIRPVFNFDDFDEEENITPDRIITNDPSSGIYLMTDSLIFSSSDPDTTEEGKDEDEV